MHEFSMARSLVDIALSELRKLGPEAVRLAKARVVVGELHQVFPDHLRFAYEALTRDTPAAGSELEIVPVPVLMRCRCCGAETRPALPCFACRRCGSGELDTLRGRELYLEHLEVETDDDQSHDQGVPGSDGRERDLGRPDA